jgi:hypothetical protein
VRVARQQGWPVSRWQRRQRVQWQQRRGRRARKRGLAGVVRAMAMARKTAMASTTTTTTKAMTACCKLPRYVPFKCTYVSYNGTFGASDQRSDARRVR